MCAPLCCCVACGVRVCQLEDWNTKVKSFMDWRVEVNGMLQANEAYWGSLNATLDAEARVAGAFVSAVVAVGNNRKYKSDAEIFQKAVADSRTALGERTLKDMEEDLNNMREAVNKWDETEDIIITCGACLSACACPRVWYALALARTLAHTCWRMCAINA